MKRVSKSPRYLFMVALLGAPVAGGLSAQDQGAVDDQYPVAADGSMTVYGTVPTDLSGMEEGPELNGIISARDGEKIQVTMDDGSNAVVNISQATEIKSSGGFLGLKRNELAANSLLNGLPVSVETVQWGNNLVASEIDLKNKDLKTANMIHTGTAQGFAEQTAATEALRGRMGDIDKYNVKATTNVNFDTGRADLSAQAKSDLCQTAAQAEATENALMLVVGYTDSTGSQEINQELSEKRAGRVVNFLQQECGWEPYRMLTPTGMAAADPMADNFTEEGKAQNRRVAVNILVSKSVEGL